jgi:uncharacterized protein YbaR (Trm112 family)
MRLAYMINKRLMELLVCPQDHTPLSEADEDLVLRLNQAIRAGQIRDRTGQVIREPIHGGLVRQDRTLLYPIVDEVPVLLVDDAIPLDQLRAGPETG